METNEALELLKSDPAYQALREKKQAEILTARKEAAGRLARTEKEAEREAPALLAAISEAETELATAEAARKKAQENFLKAKRTLAGRTATWDRERSLATGELNESADREIDAGIEWFRKQLDEIRARGITTDRAGAKTNLVNETKNLTFRTNRPAVLKALAYCKAAIEALEKLKLEPIFDPAKVEVLKKDVPDTGKMSEFSGERPLPGSKGVNPLSLLPSDELYNLQMAEINEKFRKLMTGRRK
ncbi:MAG: hypothetical protein JW836_02785 [Deltaproteobacteria bacterium]|nr:hypothetical protein [Deltaproteobacteria bacterium]